MKNILIPVAIVFSSTLTVFGQTPPVVSAPIVEATLSATNATLTSQVTIQSTMSTVIASMEESEKQFKDAMTKTTWMRNLAACQRLVAMIENLICTSKDLSIKLSGRGESCFYSYKYDMMIVKLQMSADYIGIILSGVSMSVAERAQTFKVASESFEESQEMMVEMNKSLDDDLAHEEMVQQTTKEVHDFINYDRSKKKAISK